MLSANGTPASRLRLIAVLTASAIAAAALSSCSDNGGPKKNPVTPPAGTAAPPETTRFVGYFVDGGMAGPIQITIPVALRAYSPPSKTAAGLDTVPAWAEIRFSDTLAVSLTGAFREDFQSVTLRGGGYTLWGGVSWGGPMPMMAGHEAAFFPPFANFVCYQDTADVVRVYCGLLRRGPPPGGGSIGFVRYNWADPVGLAWVAAMPERVYTLSGDVIRHYGAPDSLALESRLEGEFTFRAGATEDAATGTGSGAWFVADVMYGLAGSGEWDYETR